MKFEITLKEISEAITSTQPNIRFCLAALLGIRAAREDWVCREKQNENLYRTIFLPEDIRLILALKTSRLTKGKEQNTRVAKAILACAYRMYVQRIRHGYKGNAKRFFIRQYNLGASGLLPDVYERIGKVSSSTVEGW